VARGLKPPLYEIEAPLDEIEAPLDEIEAPALRIEARLYEIKCQKGNEVNINIGSSRSVQASSLRDPLLLQHRLERGQRCLDLGGLRAVRFDLQVGLQR
jgi:hypothetical protein